MKGKKKLIKLFTALIIWAMLICGVGVYGAYPAFAANENDGTQVTSTLKQMEVTGLKKSISKAVSAGVVIKDAIKVKPARGGKISLQLLNESTGEWKTVKKFKIPGKGSGKVTIKYPSDWKKAQTTKWRLYIPAKDGYAQYISDTITIKSSRPKKTGLKLGARSAVIIRASDGYVIYGKKKNTKRANASTTKMMTALLTLENGNLSDITAISEKAAKTGWGCLYASAGTKFAVKDLLNALLITSSNDAASALAEYNAGSVSKFAKMMNERAKELGCKNTNFVNPHGLDSKGHYSSAYDLALIQRECIKHKTYLDIVRKSRYSFSTKGKKKHHYTVYTTDALLGSRKGFLGGKTGYTGNAGLCFCGIFKYKGVTYIFTVLGNPSSQGRWNDCEKIMNFITKYYK